MFLQRSAIQVPMETTTSREAKRTRVANNDNQVGGTIIVSSRTETPVKDEPSKPASEPGTPLQRHDGDFGSSNRTSCGYPHAMEMAREALLASDTDATRVTVPSVLNVRAPSARPGRRHAPRLLTPRIEQADREPSPFQLAVGSSQGTPAILSTSHPAVFALPHTSSIPQTGLSVPINDTALRPCAENPAALHRPNQGFAHVEDVRNQLPPPQSIHSANSRFDGFDPDCAQDQTGTRTKADFAASQKTPYSKHYSRRLRRPGSNGKREASKGDSADLQQSKSFAYNTNARKEHEQQPRPVTGSQSQGGGASLVGIPADTRPSLPAPVYQPSFSTARGNHYQPPAVKFTIDNRFESILSSGDVLSLFHIFSGHVQLFLGPKETTSPGLAYSVDNLLWQSLPDFHKWYMTVSGATNVPFLRFELVDVYWELEKIFLVLGDNLHHFQELKQYVWDLFWTASHVHGTPATFKLLIDATTVATDHQPSAAGGCQMPQGPPPAAYGQPCRQEDTTNVTFPGSYMRHLGRAAQQSDYPGQALDTRELCIQQMSVVSQPPQIIIRLQADSARKFSPPYNKSVISPKITATEFFAWFASCTGRGGSGGPPSLVFTFKDAMPAPKSSMIAQMNNDHFNLMRKDIRAQAEKAGSYMCNLTEFCVLVTDPAWGSATMEEDEDW